MKKCSPQHIQSMLDDGMSKEQIERICPGAFDMAPQSTARSVSARALSSTEKPAQASKKKVARKTASKKSTQKSAAKPKTVCSERGICVRYWRWKQSPSEIGKACGMTAAEVKKVIKTTCPGDS